MDIQHSEVVLFEQQGLPVVRDLDLATLALLLQNLSALSGDVRTLIEGGVPVDELVRQFGYLDRNIRDLADAADSLSHRVPSS